MSMIHKANFRRFVFEVLKNRAHKFTRIAPSFVERCESHLRQFAASEIHRHPSTGKTLT